MKFKSKKGQLLILSVVFFIYILIFSYSLETQNTYIPYSGESSILGTIIDETCRVGYLSNGSYLDDRFSNFSADINTYCSGFGYLCNLTIVKEVTAPSNLSLLNYGHYNYTIEFKGYFLNNSEVFTC